MSEEKKIIEEEKSSYRSIFKATSLFGGVQVYQILIEVIKAKFIAVLLGPLGVGIQGLYSSAILLVQQLTSFGLASSAVRNVAEAHGTGDQTRISRVVFALRRLVWITGLLGMIGVIAFSPVLSKSSFGDSDHIIPFINSPELQRRYSFLTFLNLIKEYQCFSRYYLLFRETESHGKDHIVYCQIS